MTEGHGSGGDTAGYLGWFFLGTILGAAAAFLLTPRTGQDAREILKEKGSEFAKRAGEFAGGAQVRAGDVFDKVISAFEAGRQTMKEEMSKQNEEPKTL